MSRPLSQAALKRMVAEWLAASKRVGGPVRCGTKVLYRALESSDELELAPTPPRPANSIKGFLFPRHERLFRYELRGREIRLEEDDGAVPEQIVIAARPCDAAALPILDHVFNWDYHDEFYNRRRAATTVVSLACTAFDENCFCTSVGLAPDDPSGSDAMLHEVAGGNFEVRCFTEKGRALFGNFMPGGVLHAPVPEKKFDPQQVAGFLGRNFESPLWAAHSLACLGCGACAHTCPTCHCFDIVDEGNAAGGARVKNWDSCQFANFTAHASGHNPRSNQGQRQRQRIYHKFRMYPEKFGAILCTGCGNCARNCPAGLGVLPLVEAITKEPAR